VEPFIDAGGGDKIGICPRDIWEKSELKKKNEMYQILIQTKLFLEMY
jgi:hypothetical protein